MMVEGGGFEPPKAEPSDLQSDPFGHSGTPPRGHFINKVDKIYKFNKFNSVLLRFHMGLFVT